MEIVVVLIVVKFGGFGVIIHDHANFGGRHLVAPSKTLVVTSYDQKMICLRYFVLLFCFVFSGFSKTFDRMFLILRSIFDENWWKFFLQASRSFLNQPGP